MSRFASIARWSFPAALLLVSACAEPFSAEVKRFQALPAVGQGQSFAIAPTDPKRQGSLEFAQYAGLVSERLAGFGYQPAADAASANLIVSLDFGVDRGKEKTRIVPGSGFGYGGYGYDRFGGYRGIGYVPYYGYGRRGYPGFMYGFDDPFLFGGYPERESYTVYTSGVDMTITRKSDGQHLFEGKATAMSLSDNLTYLVPNLIAAMFTGFPGNSGETVKITVAPPPKK